MEAGHIAMKFLATPCCMVLRTVTRVINDICTGKDFTAQTNIFFDSGSLTATWLPTMLR